MEIENKHILIGGLLLIGGYLAYKDFGKEGNKNVVGMPRVSYGATYKTDESGLPEYVKVRMNMAKEMIDYQLSLGKTQAEAEAYAMDAIRQVGF